MRAISLALALLATSPAFSVDEAPKTATTATDTAAVKPTAAQTTPAKPKSASPKNSSTPLSSLSQEDKAAMGLDKLTQEQIDRLSTWFKQLMEKGSKPAAQKSAPIQIDTTIKETKEEGRYLTLATGMQIEVTGSGRKKCSTWKVDDAIRVEQGSKKGWVKLTHIPSGTRARCKILAGEMKNS